MYLSDPKTESINRESKLCCTKEKQRPSCSQGTRKYMLLTDLLCILCHTLQLKLFRTVHKNSSSCSKSKVLDKESSLYTTRDAKVLNLN